MNRVIFTYRDIIDQKQKDGVNESEYVVPVKGGRFEADLGALTLNSIYWDKEEEQRIKRCLWFYKEPNDQRFVPYDQEYCTFLEIEYEKAIRTNSFHQRIDFKTLLSTDLDHEESFVFHSTRIMLHFTKTSTINEFGNVTVSFIIKSEQKLILTFYQL